MNKPVHGHIMRLHRRVWLGGHHVSSLAAAKRSGAFAAAIFDVCAPNVATTTVGVTSQEPQRLKSRRDSNED
jgi:hypothetical protein